MTLRPWFSRTLFIAPLLALAAGCYDTAAPPADPPARIVAFERNQEAVRAWRDGDLDEALALVREAIEDDPDFVAAYTNKAGILGRLGRVDEAVAVMAEAVARAPEVAELQLLRGVFLERAEDREAARESYREAVALFPEPVAGGADPGRAVQRAVAYYLLDGRTAALREINEAIAAYPGHTPARLMKNRILSGDRRYFLHWVSDPASPGVALEDGEAETPPSEGD